MEVIDKMVFVFNDFIKEKGNEKVIEEYANEHNLSILDVYKLLDSFVLKFIKPRKSILEKKYKEYKRVNDLNRENKEEYEFLKIYFNFYINLPSGCRIEEEVINRFGTSTAPFYDRLKCYILKYASKKEKAIYYEKYCARFRERLRLENIDYNYLPFLLDLVKLDTVEDILEYMLKYPEETICIIHSSALSLLKRSEYKDKCNMICKAFDEFKKIRFREGAMLSSKKRAEHIYEDVIVFYNEAIKSGCKSLEEYCKVYNKDITKARFNYNQLKNKDKLKGKYKELKEYFKHNFDVYYGSIKDRVEDIIALILEGNFSFYNFPFDEFTFEDFMIYIKNYKSGLIQNKINMFVMGISSFCEFTERKRNVFYVRDALETLEIMRDGVNTSHDEILKAVAFIEEHNLPKSYSMLNNVLNGINTKKRR